MSILFFGGSILGCRSLKALLEEGLPPVLVITNPEDRGIDEPMRPSVQKLALELGLSQMGFKEFVKEGYKNISPPSIGFSAFCSRIIPLHIIQFCQKGITNLHFSLLPKYRGQFPTVYAIFNGDKETGVTLHWIDPGTDSGAIIEQTRVPIVCHETGESLFNQCLDAAVGLFRTQLGYLKRDAWPSPISQDPVSVNQNPIHFELPNQGAVDWNWSGEKIHNFLRALYHSAYPMPQLRIGDKLFELREIPSGE
jgi:methionyl-tRNA formyltransferase